MTADRRLPVAIGASLFINLVVWTAVGSAAAYRIVAAPPPIEFQRVIVTKEGKKTVKVVKPEEVEKRVEKAVKERRITPPKPREPAPEPRRTEPKPTRASPPPPQGAHHKVVTAKPGAAAKPPDFAALAGGKAPAGKPAAAQAPGNATTNPPNPPKTEPPPAPKTEPKADPKPASPPADPGPKTDPPKAEPPKADPPKADPPKKKGPTRDAQHSNEVNPSIPDELKGQEFKKFVRVKVEISAEGSFTVVLRTSSGNDEVDKRVLDALKKWTWKPKLVEGEPVDSTQLFRFEFEIK